MSDRIELALHRLHNEANDYPEERESQSHDRKQGRARSLPSSRRSKSLYCKTEDGKDRDNAGKHGITAKADVRNLTG